MEAVRRPVLLLLLIGAGSLASPSPPLAPPSIIALLADDPDQSEEAFADYDTLSVHFWPPTNTPGGTEELLDRTTLHGMLTFSTPIDGDYWAQWNSSSVLVITFGVVNATSAPAVRSFTVACKAGNSIFAAAGSASECAPTTSPPLRGAWGYVHPSSIFINSFVALDPDDGDEVCGVGDTLTITFNAPTDRAQLSGIGGAIGGAIGGPLPAPFISGGAGGMLDELLEFIPPIPEANLSGTWLSDSVLELRIEGALGFAFGWLGNLRVAVKKDAALRDAARSSAKTATISPPLLGDCGLPPQLASFEASDPDDGDTICGVGDIFTLRFDRPTDMPPASTRVEIDRLISFSQGLGVAYTGLWNNSKTLVITIEQTHAPPPEVGVVVATIRGEMLGFTGQEYDPSVMMDNEIDSWTRYYDAAPHLPPLHMNHTAVICQVPSAKGAANATLAIDLGNGVTLPTADVAASPLLYSYYTPPVLSAVEPLAGPWRGGTMLTVHGSFLQQQLQQPEENTLTDTNGTASSPSPTSPSLSPPPPSLLYTLTPACRFGHHELHGWHNVSMVVPAVWNGTDRAICKTPPWPRRWWPPEPNFGHLSLLTFEFLANGVDADGWALKPDGRPTRPPTWSHHDPILSSLMPLSGPRASSTPLTIHGRGFGVHTSEMGESPSLCRVGSFPPTPLLSINQTADAVVCLAPPCEGCTTTASSSSSLGSTAAEEEAECCKFNARLDVQVSTNGRDWAKAKPGGERVAFAYYDRPRVSSLGALPIGAPLSGPTLGGVSITIRGVGLLPLQGSGNGVAGGGQRLAKDELRCRFGESIVGADRVSDLGVLCVSPPMMAGIVPVSIAANGIDFQPNVATDGAGPVNAFQFEYLCSGYTDGRTCVADPSCGWCEGGAGCVPCGAANSGGCSGGLVGGAAGLVCDATQVVASSCSGAPCALLSERVDIINAHPLPQTLRISLQATLHMHSFAVYRITPHHTNFALRVSLHSPSTSRMTRMFARKDLPPTGNPIRRDQYELVPNGDAFQQRLVIGPDQLGCGQRDGESADGTWPDLLRQTPSTLWVPIQRELVGALYPPSARWADPSTFNGGAGGGGGSGYGAASPVSSSSVPHCDSWFVGVFPIAPPPPAPFQPSLVNASLSDDFFKPNPPPPATYTLHAFLEPSYLSFACADCAFPPPPPPFHFVRSAMLSLPPPPPLDRYRSTLHGDCEACGLRLKGHAERVIDVGGQRIRLVHSTPPHSSQQLGAVWYHQKLYVKDGFQIEFDLQFHRPATCARALDITKDYSFNESKAKAEDPEWAFRPYWQRRRTGCPDRYTGSGGRGTMTEAAVGGEGLALLIHNDPAGIDAAGCKGTGVGYSFDASHYGTCQERILNSVAIQLSPHFNISDAYRHGPQVAQDEPSYITWSAMDEVGVYANGDNGNPLVRGPFYRPGRDGRLIDGGIHKVVAVYSKGELRIKFDGEEQPSLNVEGFDLANHSAYDGSGEAWIGFTSSTGIAPIDADLLSFSFCRYPGCDAR